MVIIRLAGIDFKDLDDDHLQVVEGRNDDDDDVMMTLMIIIFKLWREGVKSLSCGTKVVLNQ